MGILTRVSLWTALVSSLVLLFSTGCRADSDEAARMDISGTLIKPPCTATFPASQSVAVPKVNLNTLKAGSADWTDVALGFKCTVGSQVKIRFTATNGTYDANTLRTSLDRLGLKTRLSDITSSVRVVDLKLDDELVFPVLDTTLALKLSVMPVKTAEELPAIGSYSATLLMEIEYL